jgi:hypothetical protein
MPPPVAELFVNPVGHCKTLHLDLSGVTSITDIPRSALENSRRNFSRLPEEHLHHGMQPPLRREGPFLDTELQLR